MELLLLNFYLKRPFTQNIFWMNKWQDVYWTRKCIFMDSMKETDWSNAVRRLKINRYPILIKNTSSKSSKNKKTSKLSTKYHKKQAWFLQK